MSESLPAKPGHPLYTPPGEVGNVSRLNTGFGGQRNLPKEMLQPQSYMGMGLHLLQSLATPRPSAAMQAALSGSTVPQRGPLERFYANGMDQLQSAMPPQYAGQVGWLQKAIPYLGPMALAYITGGA